MAKRKWLTGIGDLRQWEGVVVVRGQAIRIERFKNTKLPCSTRRPHNGEAMVQEGRHAHRCGVYPATSNECRTSPGPSRGKEIKLPWQWIGQPGPGEPWPIDLAWPKRQERIVEQREALRRIGVSVEQFQCLAYSYYGPLKMYELAEQIKYPGGDRHIRTIQKHIRKALANLKAAGMPIPREPRASDVVIERWDPRDMRDLIGLPGGTFKSVYSEDEDSQEAWDGDGEALASSAFTAAVADREHIDNPPNGKKTHFSPRKSRNGSPKTVLTEWNTLRRRQANKGAGSIIAQNQATIITTTSRRNIECQATLF